MTPNEKRNFLILIGKFHEIKEIYFQPKHFNKFSQYGIRFINYFQYLWNFSVQ